MPGLSFLSKKSWHTSNISNQEKVWIAEQKAAAEEAKLKELTQQIKQEREQEELQKITGKKSSTTGDRGVDWMYEGHKRGEGDEEQRQLEEDAKNEAYLLGKEYVPEGQARQSGDFAVAASMTGALEKASTVGASIGAGGEGEGGGELRIQEEGMTNNIDDNSGGVVEAAGSTMNEWNQNFHLRHEDPMFSVMKRKQAKDKDVEKKIKLMERVGMVIKTTTSNTKAEEEEEKVRYNEHEDNNKDKRRRKDSKKSKKKRKHKHKSHRRHHKRSRRDRSHSLSDDGYSSYSSSSSYTSDDDSRRERYRDRRERDKNTSRRRYHDDRHYSSERRRDRHVDDDRYNHRRDRSESRERRRRRERSRDRHDDYDRYERHSNKRGSSGRRRERSRSYSRNGRDEPRVERSYRREEDGRYNGGNNRNSRKESQREDEKKESVDKAAAAHGNSLPRKEGYGLIGTSLSNKGNNNSSSKPSSSSGDYLGPDQKLRDAKREEMERDRQSRFVQGRKRQHRGTSQERQMALEEMQRNALDRETKWRN